MQIKSPPLRSTEYVNQISNAPVCSSSLPVRTVSVKNTAQTFVTTRKGNIFQRTMHRITNWVSQLFGVKNLPSDASGKNSALNLVPKENGKMQFKPLKENTSLYEGPGYAKVKNNSLTYEEPEYAEVRNDQSAFNEVEYVEIGFNLPLAQAGGLPVNLETTQYAEIIPTSSTPEMESTTTQEKPEPIYTEFNYAKKARDRATRAQQHQLTPKPALPPRSAKPALPPKPDKPALPPKPDKAELPPKPDKPALPPKPAKPALPPRPV